MLGHVGLPEADPRHMKFQWDIPDPRSATFNSLGSDLEASIMVEYLVASYGSVGNLKAALGHHLAAKLT